MKFSIRVCLVVYALFLIAPQLRGVLGQDSTTNWPPDIQAIVDAGRNGNQVQEHLHYLTNRIGPRLTGSEGLQAGCQWAVEKFEQLGLASRLEKWGEFPVGFERGPSSGQMLEPKKMELTFGTNAWTAGTRGRVIGNAVIGPQNVEELQQVKNDLKDKFVLVSSPPRGERGQRGREAFEGVRQLREELIKCEPAGIIHAAIDDLIITGGNYRVEWDNLPTVPVINLLGSQFAEISQLIEDGQEVKLSFDIRNYFRKGPVQLYNVIADIPGTEWPDQYVVVGGHIDSWDGATGATDNAAGCATTIEAARILMEAGVKPRRTIRFMLWSGEEQGLLGSRAYVQANPKVVDNVSCVLVHDGGTNYVAGIGCPQSMKEDFDRIFAAANQLDERTPFEVYVVESMRPRGGSDHASFIQGGAPGFFWRQRGRAVYRQTHHTQYDTYETIVPEYQEHSSIVIALGAYGIANLDKLLPRDAIEAR